MANRNYTFKNYLQEQLHCSARRLLKTIRCCAGFFWKRENLTDEISLNGTKTEYYKNPRSFPPRKITIIKIIIINYGGFRCLSKTYRIFIRFCPIKITSEYALKKKNNNKTLRKLYISFLIIPVNLNKHCLRLFVFFSTIWNFLTRRI